MRPHRFKPGDVVGGVKVVRDSGVRGRNGQVIFHCKCLSCGKPYTARSEVLRKRSHQTGCPVCVAADKSSKALKNGN